MRRSQSGQALVELAASVFVLLVFGLAILAVGQVVGEYMAVRAAATQAAFAAARAPSQQAAVQAGTSAAKQAVVGSQLRELQITVDTGGFQRGGELTASASGCVGLQAFSVAAAFLGDCVPLRWQAHALIEPYRSRQG